MPHTPGPWSVERSFNEAHEPDGALASVVGGGDDHNYYIAQVWSDFEASKGELAVKGIPPHGTAEANARLIAAAPDLLAALKGLRADHANKLECIENWLGDQRCEECRIADLAIAKAEGR